MFIAGLELDLNEFKSNRNKSLLFGFFTFSLPFAIGIPVCIYIFKYDINTSLLISSMFATHTLVAYPIVSKMGVSKNQAVAVTVGGTILTDTAVLILLAIITKNHQGNLNNEFWLSLGISLIVFSAIMFLIVPRVSQWFFKKLESEKYAHYIYVLSVVFFSAFLAEIAGIESIIGAFIAGLVLNKLIPHSSALMNRIDFIGNSLFIPFFLISVGMLVDVSVIMHGPETLILAGILTAVALFTKWSAAFLVQIIFKYTKAQRQLIFGLSSSRAAATLAVILVGYKAQIVDDKVLNATFILILITCIVASFVSEKASIKILLDNDSNDIVSEKLTNFSDEHILIPAASQKNLEKLIELSLLIKDKKSANPVTILSVVPNNEQAEINIINTRKKLETFVKQGAASEINISIITTIDHNEANGIARISREIMSDVLVMEWPDKSGFFDKIFGEKIYSVVNNVDKNIFICKISKPLVSIKKVSVISPPFAERENGFITWVQKLVKFSKELGISVVHFGNDKTQEVIKLYIEKSKSSVSFSYKNLESVEDFLVISGEIHHDDLIVLTSARKNSISYNPFLENMPSKIEKYFAKNSIVVIFPQQFGNNIFNEIYDDFSTETLSKGIEKISKGIGNIFTGKKK
jgi:Kef-type K+ transport system membrane component KefB